MNNIDKAYVNYEEGLNRLRNNVSLYKRMLGMILASDEFGKFDAFLDSGDIKGAADSAHAIKGMTGNLSLTALFDISVELMNTLREEAVDEGMVASYREILKTTMEQVKLYVDTAE